MVASCPLSAAFAILLSFRAYPTVTTFTRGQNGAYLERRRGRERIPEFSIGFKPFDNLYQILMFTPRRLLRGRWQWMDESPPTNARSSSTNSANRRWKPKASTCRTNGAGGIRYFATREMRISTFASFWNSSIVSILCGQIS